MDRIWTWGGWQSSPRLRLLRRGPADCLLRVARSSGDDGPWGAHDRRQGRWLLPANSSQKQVASIRCRQQGTSCLDDKWTTDGPQVNSSAFLGLPPENAIEMLAAGEWKKPSVGVLNRKLHPKSPCSIVLGGRAALPRLCRPADNRPAVRLWQNGLPSSRDPCQSNPNAAFLRTLELCAGIFEVHTAIHYRLDIPPL